MENDTSLDSLQNSIYKKIAEHKKVFSEKGQPTFSSNPIVSQFVRFVGAKNKFSIKDSYFR